MGAGIGESIGDAVSGGKLARALMLKQLTGDMSEASARRKAAVSEAVKAGFGVQETNGELFLTEEAKKFYTPEEQWLAVQNYPQVKVERTAKQLENAKKGMELIQGISEQVDKAISKYNDKRISPEYVSTLKQQALTRLGEVFSSVYGDSAFGKYGIGEIASKMAELPLKEMTNEINIKIAMEAQNEILSGKANSFTHRDFKVSYGSLPPEIQQTLMEPDKLMEKYPPTDLTKMQQDIARKTKQMEAGIQAQKEVQVEEEKRKRGLGTYGSYRIVQTDQGTFYVPVRPGENGENVVPLKGPEGTTLGKPLPSDQLNKVSDLLTLKDNINRTKELFKNTYVGPVMGRLGAVGEKLVNLPEDQVMFYSYVRDMKDALLRARSGAQINEQEYKRLVSFLPDENLPEKNFQSRMKRFEEEINTILNNKMKMLKSGGYGTGGIQTNVETPSPQSNKQRFKILKVE